MQPKRQENYLLYTRTDGEMKVHFLDVGQGLSILVQSDGQTMI